MMTGRIYTNHSNPDTRHNFAGALGRASLVLGVLGLITICCTSARSAWPRSGAGTPP